MEVCGVWRCVAVCGGVWCVEVCGGVLQCMEVNTTIPVGVLRGVAGGPVVAAQGERVPRVQPLHAPQQRVETAARRAGRRQPLRLVHLRRARRLLRSAEPTTLL